MAAAREPIVLEPLAPGLPDARESALARDSSRRLRSYLAGPHRKRLQEASLRLAGADPLEESVPLPASALRLLVGILNEMAQGNAVTLVPVHAALTTQQAADFLGVSRPFLVGLLERGQIPFHKAGTHRRVFFQDALAYKERADAARRETLAELAALSQDLGLGY